MYTIAELCNQLISKFGPATKLRDRKHLELSLNEVMSIKKKKRIIANKLCTYSYKNSVRELMMTTNMAVSEMEETYITSPTFGLPALSQLCKVLQWLYSFLLKS